MEELESTEGKGTLGERGGGQSSQYGLRVREKKNGKKKKEKSDGRPGERNGRSFLRGARGEWEGERKKNQVVFTFPILRARNSRGRLPKTFPIAVDRVHTFLQ